MNTFEWTRTLFLILCSCLITISASGEEMPVPAPAEKVPAPPAAVGPAAAFPADTCFYLEIDRPVDVVDRISRMSFWPQAMALIDEMSGFLLGEGDQFLPPSSFLGKWGEASEFRSRLQTVANTTLAVAWIPVPGSDRLVPVVAARGSASGDRIDSLAWLLRCFSEAGVEKAHSIEKGGAFSVHTSDGTRILHGMAIEQWLLLAPAGGRELMENAARVLARGGSASAASLAGNQGFQNVMAALPPSSSARAYLDCRQAAARIESCCLLSETGKRLARLCLGWTDAVGLAREVGEDGIHTWMTGQVLEDQVNAAIPGLLDSMTSIREPLSAHFPENALLTYEVGLPLEALYDTACYFLHELAPWLGSKVDALRANFVEAAQLDPESDLYPFLGSSVAAAWLPADLNESRWPFPRTVVLMRIKDREKVKAFITQYLKWDASVWAPVTGGLISAATRSESFRGVELMGIELDSLIRLPLPSPTFALMDDLLIASAVPSGVKETILAIQGKTPMLSAKAIESAGPLPDGAIEVVHLNPRAWESDWEKIRIFAVPAICSLLLDSEFLAGSRIEKKVKSAMQALIDLLVQFERTTGTTVIDENNRFTFYIAVRGR